MGGFAAGIVAVLVGGGLAVATTIGVVQTVDDGPDQTTSEVVDYGSR